MDLPSFFLKIVVHRLKGNITREQSPRNFTMDGEEFVDANDEGISMSSDSDMEVVGGSYDLTNNVLKQILIC